MMMFTGRGIINLNESPHAFIHDSFLLTTLRCFYFRYAGINEYAKPKIQPKGRNDYSAL